jgi:hypothetical protein
VLVAVGMSVLVACGGGADKDEAGPAAAATVAPAAGSPTTVAGAATATSVPGETTPIGRDAACGSTTVSSRADFDARNGQYAAYLYGVNPSRPAVSFDVVQLLQGDDAARAYHADYPADQGGPPEGSYIVNAAWHTDESPVSADVSVWVQHPTDAGVIVPSTMERVLEPQFTSLGGPGFGLFWLTFRDGLVTGICQQDKEWHVEPTMASPAGNEDFGCGVPGTSSRADFDPRSGQYAVYLYGVNSTTQTVAFDVVQFLVGDDAARAYHEENPTDPNGPPNDYQIVNALKHTDEAVVAGAIRIFVSGSAGALGPSSLTDLPNSPRGRHPGYGLFYMTFSNGRISDMCQKYTP